MSSGQNVKSLKYFIRMLEVTRVCKSDALFNVEYRKLRRKRSLEITVKPR
jgi:hypothetical protein